MTVIKVTKHAQNQLYERFGKTSFKKLIPRYKMVLYQDNFKSVKYYFNLSPTDPDGFLVLKQIGRDTFIIKTITDNGRIDSRDVERKIRNLKFVELRE